MNFTQFFSKATGFAPFPYQVSLASADLTRLALAAPTGAGKTAAATLAWLWQRQQNPETTPRRLILCEPQRTLVEQVHQEVMKWRKNLGLEQTFSIHALQGGYVDQRWELNPELPAVIIGTQDQLLSRALNRGFAMSRFRWPIHFGLLHNDVQWVFDEIQLMGPGLTTSAQLQGLRQKLGHLGNARTLWMSATLNTDWLNTIDHIVDDGRQKLEVHPFGAEDKAVPDMAARLHAKKPLHRLAIFPDSKTYVDDLAKEVQRLHRPGHFTLVIVNTVKRARELHAKLAKKQKNLHLLHSRFRPDDRQDVLNVILNDKGEKLVISTQVVEAGVDISADLMITEVAPRSSMIQRFGRCNRRGDKDHAEVYWVELAEKSAGPYEWADLKKSIDEFSAVTSVEPAQFEDRITDALPLYDTLRRRDLLDLFETSSDLSGLDIDVNRFIRDGDQRDIFVFWRHWFSEKPPADLAAPRHGELCKVDRFEAAELVKKGRLQLWLLDDLDGKKNEWKLLRSQDLVTGRTYLAHATQGHYTKTTGWTPDSKEPVQDLLDTGIKSPFPAMGSDSLSEKFEEYLTLWQHTEHVCEELENVVAPLSNLLGQDLVEKLRLAALWHDVGKAHQVFQNTMIKDAPDTLDLKELWAKRIGNGFHERRYFRHELASALAAWQHNIDPLVIYLVASHHGKARVSIRSFPEETDNAVLGIRPGDQLPAINFPGKKPHLAALVLDPTTLNLDVFRLGGDSWQARALSLRDDPGAGPFRLAYLEALLRSADVRASIKEKEGKYAHA